jgi:regulator of protease activity HflC (stomatin/prohibitin superfamily)
MCGELLLLLVVAVLYAALGLKLSGKNERLIIYQNGEPMSVCNHRFAFILPFVQSVRRLYVGTHEVYLPTVKLADFPQGSLVSCKFRYRIHDPLKAAKNPDLQKATELAVQSTLMFIISSATIEQCLRESYYLEKQAIEVVNRQTRAWGVTVSMLTLSNFELHRDILCSIETILTAVNFELAALIKDPIAKNAALAESVNESAHEDPLFNRVMSAALKLQAKPQIYESFAKSNLLDTNA